jgi:hypothetical protein
VCNELVLNFGGTNLPFPMLHIRKPLALVPVRSSIWTRGFWCAVVFSLGIFGGSRYGSQIANSHAADIVQSLLNQYLPALLTNANA